jgi:hypothetical protein
MKWVIIYTGEKIGYVRDITKSNGYDVYMYDVYMSGHKAEALIFNSRVSAQFILDDHAFINAMGDRAALFCPVPICDTVQGTYWLIECGSPAIYFCGPGDWCSNPNHAHLYTSKILAESEAASMTTIEPIRVCDHAWVGAQENKQDNKQENKQE